MSDTVRECKHGKPTYAPWCELCCREAERRKVLEELRAQFETGAIPYFESQTAAIELIDAMLEEESK